MLHVGCSPVSSDTPPNSCLLLRSGRPRSRLARVQFNGNVRTRMREAASREQLVNALSYNRFGSLPAEHFDVSVEGARRAKRVVVHEHVPFIDFEEVCVCVCRL